MAASARGLALALLVWMSPYALPFGEVQLSQVTTADVAVGTLLVAAVAALLRSSVTLVGGWKGGFIIPLFFMGACLGQAVHIVFPHTNQAVIAVSPSEASSASAGARTLASTTSTVLPDQIGRHRERHSSASPAAGALEHLVDGR